MAGPLHDENNDGVCFAPGAFGHDSNMGVIRSEYVPRNRVIVLNRRSTRSYTTNRMFDNSGNSGPLLGVTSFRPVVSPFYICDTSGVATDQISTGPRLRFTVLMMYTPLCVIGASRIATPDELLTVCTTVPEGSIRTN